MKRTLGTIGLCTATFLFPAQARRPPRSHRVTRPVPHVPGNSLECSYKETNRQDTDSGNYAVRDNGTKDDDDEEND